MYRRVSLLLLGLSLLSTAAAIAQGQAAGPPPVLLISREEIKPGSMGSHEKQVTSYLALFNKANVGAHRLGLVPVSGDDNQVLYLEGYASFADLEATRKKFGDTMTSTATYQAELEQLERQGGPMHATQRTVIAVHRPDLSYRPLKVEEVARSRYFSITTNRIKPGRAADYVEYVKQFNRAREKANIDAHTAVYQVISGAPGGTLVTFSANRSLAEWDEFTRTMEARNKAIDEALGGESVVKQRREMAEQIFADSFTALYAFNPKISRPSPEFAAADPGFWTPKPAAKAVASKKEATKQATKEAKN